MNTKVIFTRNHSIASIFLRGCLWSPWSHCALIDGDEVIEASALHGVRRRPLQALIQDSTKWEIVEFPVEENGVLTMAQTQLGKPYDWGGVFGIGIRRRWQDADSWFCSELVAWAMEKAGFPLFRTQAWRITPQHLYLPRFLR